MGANVTVRSANRTDIPGIVWVSKSSILPSEDMGFGGGSDSPFRDLSKLSLLWEDPNIVRKEEVLVAEQKDRIVGCTTIQDRGLDLELINIDVPLELQGKGIGTKIIRYVEDKARNDGKRAVTLGTSRNEEGVAWKSLAWWEHQGYRIIHEEENEWTRSIGPKVREIRMRKEL